MADEIKDQVPEVPEEKPKTVTVKKDKLDEILSTNEALTKKMEEQQKTIDMLLATADKARIARYQDQNQSPVIRTMKLRTFKGKVVVGWRMVKDEMYKDANGVFHERQIVEIVTEDGETAELPYLESEKLPKIVCNVKGKLTQLDDSGVEHVVYTLLTPEGKEYKIDHTFVN
jgi:hypothetical protein